MSPLDSSSDSVLVSIRLLRKIFINMLNNLLIILLCELLVETNIFNFFEMCYGPTNLPVWCSREYDYTRYTD